MANYKDSPFGTAVHAHINKADRGVPGKFESAPTFKVDLKLDGDEAITFKELVDGHCEAAFEAFKETEQYEKMKPKDKRELSVYYPYEEVEDDDGNKTGEIIFNFRQNERIKLRDGTFKVITIGTYDAKGKEFKKLIRSGSELRVKYSVRGIKAPSTPPKYGVRLDFMGVQVIKLAQGIASGGFSAVDGGYEDDGQSFNSVDDSQVDDNTPSQSDDADY